MDESKHRLRHVIEVEGGHIERYWLWIIHVDISEHDL